MKLQVIGVKTATYGCLVRDHEASNGYFRIDSVFAEGNRKVPMPYQEIEAALADGFHTVEEFVKTDLKKFVKTDKSRHLWQGRKTEQQFDFPNIGPLKAAMRSLLLGDLSVLQ